MCLWHSVQDLLSHTISEENNILIKGIALTWELLVQTKNEDSNSKSHWFHTWELSLRITELAAITPL